MSKKITLFITLLTVLASCKKEVERTVKPEPVKEAINWNSEIIYHVLPRSFYDSNGDLHGDLNGFVEKLDYLKTLGVTTILFTPLYESEFYHNYFPTNYYNIDPEYGTKEDYIHFIKAVHEKGLKFLMDMETQYVQNGNIWFDDSYKNPHSEYSDFIYYTDSLNQYPEQIFMPAQSPLFNFKAWPENEHNDKTHNIAILDLNNERVKQWMKTFYTYWLDPNKDGEFDDGVDGFRIDHIMDDLDNKGIISNMYRDFWSPVFSACKEVNPDVLILGEQANWGEYGDEMVNQSGADAAFNFPLKFTVATQKSTQDMYKSSKHKTIQFNPEKIHEVVQESSERFKDNTYFINFIENHDTDRWATLAGGHKGKIQTAAILNLLLPGVPSIYYGQELGVTGKAKEDWGSDTNHIPIREAFPWTADYNEKGIAVWYKDTGPWWELSFWQTDAIEQLALSVQQEDDNSLWNHYRTLIELRTSYPALQYGDYEPLLLNEKRVMAFKRTLGETVLTVIVNTANTQIQLNTSIEKQNILYSNTNTETTNVQSLKPYEFVIFK